MITLFSNVGIEPTFYKVNGMYCDQDDLTKIKGHPWMRNAYIDDEVLEIPSTVYSSYAKLEKAYVKLVDVLGGQGYVPSSLLSMEEQGNCHINFDFSDVYHAINLINFLNTYPSIVWALITANDNISSKIITTPISLKKDGTDWLDKYEKGRMLTFRHRLFHVHRVELRFFKQPRTILEFRNRLRIANSILFLTNQRYYDHIRKVRGMKYLYKMTNTAETLQNYTYKKALSELHYISKVLGLNIERFDIGQLKLRFSYGKEYLV